MTRPLKRHHRARIDRLFEDGKDQKLTEVLHRLHNRGFDVAAVPFRLLDAVFTQNQISRLPALSGTADVTLGGQPSLFRAILHDATMEEPNALRQLVDDTDAHPMSRFEAMGWDVFLRNRSDMPMKAGAAKSVFQFWDEDQPPEEIRIAREAWASLPIQHSWFSEDAAHDYVHSAFGADAARSFAALWHPALKSDVFRLYHLVHDGGIYADADSLPGPGLAEFTATCGKDAWAVSGTNVPNCVVNNWFLAAPPKAPVFEAFLEHVLGNLAKAKHEGIFWLSGPGALTSFLYRQPHRMRLLPLQIQKRNLLSQFDAQYKRTPRNWRVFEFEKGITDAPALKKILEERNA